MAGKMLMVDYAKSDRRSVAAMLRDKGDGRELAWLEFEKLYPESADPEALQRAYASECRKAGADLATRPKRSVLAYVLMILGVLFIVS